MPCSALPVSDRSSLLRYCLFVLAMCVALMMTSPVRAAPDAEYMASLVHAAARDGRDFPDFHRINPHLDEAQLYMVQKHYVALRVADGVAVSGFKGGFVPRAPVGGVLFDDGALAPGASIRAQDYRRLVIEAEIAFNFCRAVDAPLADIASLREAVCTVAPALEVVAAAFADFAALRQDFNHLRRALIPTSVGAWQYVLGAPVPAADAELAALPVRMTHDGETLGQRKLETAPDLWQALLWVVNDFVLREGYGIAPGQFIIPGNLTGIHVGEPGEWQADFGALGTLELTVTP